MNNGTSEYNLISTIRLYYVRHMIIPVLLIIISAFLIIKIPFHDIIVPQNIDNLSDLNTKNENHVEHFSLSSQNWLYSGYNNYKDSSIREYIFYNIVDDKCYFLLALPEDVDTTNMTLKNESIQVTLSKRTDSFNSFLNQFALDINWRFDSLNEITSDIILTTQSYNIGFYKILFYILTIILIYMLMLALYMTTLTILPTLCPILGRKHRHSLDAIKSRNEFALLLQTELDNYLYNTDEIFITKNYLINLSSEDICIIPLNKLCFIFEHGNLHKFLWFYMKVTHTIYFLCNNALKCHFTHKNSGNIDSVMNLLKELIPDLMVGYSTENQMKYMEILKGKKS